MSERSEAMGPSGQERIEMSDAAREPEDDEMSQLDQADPTEVAD